MAVLSPLQLQLISLVTAPEFGTSPTAPAALELDDSGSVSSRLVKEATQDAPELRHVLFRGPVPVRACLDDRKELTGVF